MEGVDLLGTILDDRYRVEATLGSAHAGGTVYRGRDATTGATVVVRCPLVPPRLTSEEFEAALATFLAEAELLARIGQSSNDVERLLASGLAESHGGSARVPFTIFEWLAGRSLERHRAGSFPRGGKVEASSISEAIVTLEPAARALAVAHALGTAHRDIRPANLWLAELGGRTTLKVAAFGLATRFGPGDTAFVPEYGAPEHFKRSYGPLGPATDVYGLALCIVEMVTGERALEGADAGELYLATSNLQRRPTPRARGAHVSDAVEAVLARALAVDPKRRWQSARELWDALVAAVPDLTPASAHTGEPPSVRSAATLAVREDSGPASMPPGMTLLEDARLGESGRIPLTTRPSTSTASSARSADAPDKSGTWAWLAVAALAVIVIGVVVSKIGAPTPTDTAKPPLSHVPVPVPVPETIPEAGPAPEPPDMLRIAAGTFIMGSDHDNRPERPAHRVTISHAFYIDRTEVRAEAYGACIADKACGPNRVHTAEMVETAYGCSTAKDRPQHPVNCIDRMQAEKYCAFVKKRLPTEAEWEYAARGTDGREYPWGNTAPTSCAMAILTGMSGGCGERRGTWEVGMTLEGKSAFGALDMAGNVWEWVADGYAPYPSATSDAGVDGGADGVVDPRVPLAAYGRGVLRGGSWDYSVTSAKVTYRLPFVATTGNVSTGFRCARD